MKYKQMKKITALALSISMVFAPLQFTQSLNPLKPIISYAKSDNPALFAIAATETFDGKIIFADKAFENAVREILGKTSGEISTEEVTNVTQLNLSSKGITNLSGIQYFKGLKTLDISNNKVCDLTPITGLTALTSLKAASNHITNVDGLQSLTKLEELDLSDNEIGTEINGNTSDIYALESLVNLTSLNLDKNNIVDIYALANMTKMKTLSFNKNKVEDIYPLEKMTVLTTLSFDYNNVSDLGGLIECSALTSLTANNNTITSLYGIDNMSSLKTLNLNHNRISDINGIENAKSLTELYLNDNQISDLTPLSSLTRLNTVVLSNNIISDIEPMLNLINIRTLYLNNNGIEDITSLRRMANLKILNLHDNSIFEPTRTDSEDESGESVQGKSVFDSLTNITDLSLYHNYFSDAANCSYYAKIAALKSLDLDVNEEMDVSALNALIGFKTLYIDSLYGELSETTQTKFEVIKDQLDIIYFEDDVMASRVSDQLMNTTFDTITIRDAKEIKTLDLTDNNYYVSSIYGIEYLENLEELNMNVHESVDLTPLLSFENLNKGTIMVNGAIELELLANLKEKGLEVYCSTSDKVDFEGNTSLEEAMRVALGKSDDENITTKDIEELTFIDLTNTGLTELTCIDKFTNLSSLIVTDNSIELLSPIANLPNLHYLDVGNNYITTFDNIAQLKNLKYLFIGNNNIANITNSGDLSSLESLVHLELNANEVENIAVLKTLPALTSLTLNNNSIIDISPLVDMTGLKYVDIRDNIIEIREGSDDMKLIEQIENNGTKIVYIIEADESTTEEPSTESTTEDPSTESTTEDPSTESTTEEPSTESTTEDPSDYKHGDVNHDNVIDVQDAAATLEKVLNNDFSNIDTSLADVNNNGVITSSDAVFILYKSLDPDFVFPIDKK